MKGCGNMKLEEAIKKAEKEYKGMKVDTALDIGEAWVFGFCGENGEEVDISPCLIHKESGEIDVFFPPAHIKELENAIEIEL